MMKRKLRVGLKGSFVRLVAGMLATGSALGVYGVGIVAEPCFNIFYVSAVALTGAHVFRGGPRSLTAKLLVALASTCLALAVADLALRPFLAMRYYYRPHDRFIGLHPDVRMLTRYRPGASYAGRVYGDLAAVSGAEPCRDYRWVRFQVDDRGYRNDPARAYRTCNTVVLGDSYGVGIGTTQDRTWAGVLTRQYGRDVYNLSIPGGPWEALMHLSLEIHNISLQTNAWIIWSFFEGNDLSDTCSPILDASELPRKGRLESLQEQYQAFRSRSPICRMWGDAVQARPKPSAEKSVLERKFLNGRSLLFWAPYFGMTKCSRDEILRHPNSAMLNSVFAAAKRLADAQGCRVGLVFVPCKEDVYSWVIEQAAPWSTPAEPSALGRVVREMAESNGFAFLDVKPRFVIESRKRFEESGEILWWYDDTHLNERGNALLAEAVFRELLSRASTSSRSILAAE